MYNSVSGASLLLSANPTAVSDEMPDKKFFILSQGCAKLPFPYPDLRFPAVLTLSPFVLDRKIETRTDFQN